MLVQIDPVEAQYVESVAAMRHAQNLLRPNRARLDVDGRDEHALGAYGEYAASIVLDTCWRPVVRNPWDDLAADLGDIVEVRTTKQESHTSLILHHRDPDRSAFVLVRRMGPLTFSVDGWMWGHLGKQGHFWRTNVRSPAFFVPLEELRPIEELRAGLAKMCLDEKVGTAE